MDHNQEQESDPSAGTDIVFNFEVEQFSEFTTQAGTERERRRSRCPSKDLSRSLASPSSVHKRSSMWTFGSGRRQSKAASQIADEEDEYEKREEGQDDLAKDVDLDPEQHESEDRQMLAMEENTNWNRIKFQEITMVSFVVMVDKQQRSEAAAGNEETHPGKEDRVYKAAQLIVEQQNFLDEECTAYLILVELEEADFLQVEERIGRYANEVDQEVDLGDLLQELTEQKESLSRNKTCTESTILCPIPPGLKMSTPIDLVPNWGLLTTTVDEERAEQKRLTKEIVFSSGIDKGLRYNVGKPKIPAKRVLRWNVPTDYQSPSQAGSRSSHRAYRHATSFDQGGGHRVAREVYKEEQGILNEKLMLRRLLEDLASKQQKAEQKIASPNAKHLPERSKKSAESEPDHLRRQERKKGEAEESQRRNAMLNQESSTWSEMWDRFQFDTQRKQRLEIERREREVRLAKKAEVDQEPAPPTPRRTTREERDAERRMQKEAREAERRAQEEKLEKELLEETSDKKPEAGAGREVEAQAGH